MPEVNIIVKAKDEASRVLQGVGGNLGKLGIGFASAGALGVTALAGVGIAAGKLAYDAAMVEPVKVTFDNLTESIGSTADSMLDKLRPATMGVLRDVDLMKAANKLMAMGLATSEEEAAKLAEMAVTLGTAMGVDATTSLENFTLMLANQSIPRLDTFGISSGKVRERIEDLMTANEDMTRETAFMIATMEEGRTAMERVGDVSGTGAVKMAEFRAAFGNFKDEIGEALLPVLHELLDKVLTPLAQKLGELAPIITDWIGKAVAFLTGKVSELGGSWSDTWSKIVEFFQPAIDFIMPLLRQAMDIIGEIASIVLPALRGAWDEAWKFICEVLLAAWEGFKPSLEEMAGVIKDFIDEMLPRLKEAWETVWSWIEGNFVPWLRDTLIPLLQDWWDKLEPVREIIIKLAGAVGRFMGHAAVLALKGFLQGVIDLFDMMGSVIGTVIDKIQTLIDWIQRAIDWWHDLQGTGGGGGGGVPSTPGGFHQMGLAYVPTSPYYAVLHRGEAVLTKEQAELWRMGQEVHFHFGDSYGIDGVREAVEAAIEEKRRYSK